MRHASLQLFGMFIVELKRLLGYTDAVPDIHYIVVVVDTHTSIVKSCFLLLCKFVPISRVIAPHNKMVLPRQNQRTKVHIVIYLPIIPLSRQDKTSPKKKIFTNHA